MMSCFHDGPKRERRQEGERAHHDDDADQQHHKQRRVGRQRSRSGGHQFLLAKRPGKASVGTASQKREINIASPPVTL